MEHNPARVGVHAERGWLDEELDAAEAVAKESWLELVAQEQGAIGGNLHDGVAERTTEQVMRELRAMARSDYEGSGAESEFVVRSAFPNMFSKRLNEKSGWLWLLHRRAKLEPRD